MTVEDSRYFNQDPSLPVFCLEGARACPPEDVGGVPGYLEFCRIMKDPSHKEHEGFLEWYGVPYDSERFDVDFINLELMKYLRWSRNRWQRWMVI